MPDLTDKVTEASGGQSAIGKTSAGLDVNMSARVVSNLKTDNTMQVIPAGDLLNQSLEKTTNEIVNTKFANFDSKATSLYPLSQIMTNELAQKTGEPYKGIVATMIPAKALNVQSRS